MRPPPSLEPIGGMRLPQVYLLPGTLHCTAEPTRVTTVLGSCVAVCMSDRARGLSGINHFMLPHSGYDPPGLRHGDVAIDRLLDEMLRLGGSYADIEAKIFGGAAVLPMNTPENNIGTRNVDVAITRLRALRIPVVARRTGGKKGLSVRLFTASGDVLVRLVASSVVLQADHLSLVHDAGRRPFRPGSRAR